MCVRCPTLLTEAILRDGRERLAFFRERLGLVAPFEDLCKMISRSPALLWLGVDVSMRPNVDTVQK